MCIPAAFTLVRSESKSSTIAVCAAALVPCTPILWPVAWNDFREVQLAFPFVLWAIQGFRSRSLPISALGVVGVLASRQEYALFVASLAILPPLEPEAFRRTLRWSLWALAIGIGWVLVYFAYLMIAHEPFAPVRYLGQFRQNGTWEGAGSATLELLAIGLASWSVLAVLAPRVAILAVPWVTAMRQWNMTTLSSTWHDIRYATPLIALILASGLIGFSRLGTWCLRRRSGTLIFALSTLVVALGLLAGKREVDTRISRSPRFVDPSEVASVWLWIGRVRPSDGVLSTYPVSAPLSSRRWLYGYDLQLNFPPGFPKIPSGIAWAFVERGEVPAELLTKQGFSLVFEGRSLLIYRRG
jgi:uncharacterized membrane protein